MICPYCGSFTPDGSHFCCRCATRLPEPSADPVSEENISCVEIPVTGGLSRGSAPQPKKGRVWPPLLILGILFAVGLSLFIILNDTTTSDPTMPWFTVENGTLYFDESLYTGISDLTVPASVGGQAVTAIGENCFSDCTYLTTVYLPDGIEKIGAGAFSGCTSLRGIQFPDTLSVVGNYAFVNCASMEAICIPQSVMQVGQNAFFGCIDLTYVFYTGPMVIWETLNVNFPHSEVTVYCSDGVYPQV